MDSEYSAHDPYKSATEQYKAEAAGKSGITPDKKSEESTAREELQDAESAAGGFYNKSKSAKEGEENPSGFNYTGAGKSLKKASKAFGGMKIVKMSAVGVIVFIIALFSFGIVALGSPIFTIGHLDFNLQDALGFTKTTGILQKIATRIIQKKLMAGEMPDGLANDLAEHDIMVGQVTVAGDFVRTNVYVADVEKLKDLAVLDHVGVVPDEGQLAILYDGQVVKAEDFVATVESNLKLFADYTEAVDISAKFYYSNEVDQVYNDMGLSRSAFAGWTDTGDQKQNEEKFAEMMEEALNNDSDLAVTAYNAGLQGATSWIRKKNTLISPAPVRPDDLYVDPNTGRPNGNVVPNTTTDVTGDSNNDADSDSTSGDVDNVGSEGTVIVSSVGDATDIINQVAEKSTGQSATAKAAQLLNTAISAGEPYLAASAFIGVEAPIQQARIEGTGPVNELMNMLNAETEVTYINSSTKEIQSVKKSILTTGNFVAAVSGGKFSTAEASSFSRDRAILMMDMGKSDLIKSTSISTEGQNKSSILIPVSVGETADQDALSILSDSISMAMVEKNSDLITSQVGGNRIVEGGSFLSNTINTHVIAAMPSDEETIVAYNREANVEMDRMAAAERATKSPFDISSPYTFMGSIVHGFADAMIQNGGSGNVISNSVGTVASLTDNATRGIWNSAVADGEDDTDYGNTFGQYCDTVKSVSAEGDIYCTAQGVITTEYADYDDEDWNNALKGDLENGEIKEDSELSIFIDTAMDRWATVGVKSADVCERYREKKENIFGKLAHSITSILGIYESCGILDDELESVGTGARYTIRNGNGYSENVKKYAGYVVYDKVSSWLDGTVSKVTAYQEKYREEHPLDNSRAGRIARISGMTKSEAEVALAYADYLTFIARYNPAERYAFGVDLIVDRPTDPLVQHANQVAVDLYVMWHGRVEYDDLRTRTRVA